MFPLFAFFNLGGQEVVVLLILGVLLFGRKLPEVGRCIGQGLKEIQNGFRGVEDSYENTTAQPAAEQPRPPQRIATNAPKFEANGTDLSPATPT
jgi:sec-independent protein translocase protein TatA